MSIPGGGYHRTAVTLIAIATHLSICLPKVIGCECAPPPPPCEEYSATPMVFLGTVTEFLQAESAWVMRIDRAYKGVSEKTLLLYDQEMCPGPKLQVGEQYLMYTERINLKGFRRDLVPNLGCTRSRSVEYAEEDLKYLNGLRTAAPTGAVFGQVTVRSDEIGSKAQPAPGAKVQIRGAGRTLTATADSEGHYSFSGLKPATYSVTASQPGFSKSEADSDDPARVAARGCRVIDVVLRKDWPATISGHVARSDGTPAPAGIWCSLIRVQFAGLDAKSQVLLAHSAQTDGEGNFTFHGVPPGRYKVALNLYRLPTPEDPYPTIYWPGATTQVTASEIKIGETSVPQKCDFQLPTELKATKVSGVVLFPDGKPAKFARVEITPQNFGRAAEPVADASGRFWFMAMEGFDYTLTAVMSNDAWVAADVKHFSAGKAPPFVTLMLALKPVR
jgi:hypothetical protein